MNLGRFRLQAVVIAVAVLACGASVAAAMSSSDGPPSAEESGPSPTATRTQASPEPTPSAPPSLLPDVRSLPAGELSIETTADGRLLRFSATLANDGPGPAEVVPDDSRVCPAGQHHAVQRLYLDGDGDGRFERAVDTETRTRPAGCMLSHPDHDHWHFDAMARYALTPVGSATPVAENNKVSFCLRDNIAVPGAAGSAPAHYGECETNLSVQGISPGWADVYTARLADQHLPLPDGLADGTYCLHTEADPLRRVQEIDDTDNAAVLAVQISGTSVAALAESSCEPLPPLD